MLLELSNGCNQECIFCANAHMQRPVGLMENDLVIRILDEGRQAGVTEVGFHATGEPFLHSELENFVRYAAKVGYQYIYFSTNGALASPARAKAVIDAGLNSIKFSINAGSRELYQFIHGRDDWQKVMDNLHFISDYRKTLERPFYLFATYIITRQNESECQIFQNAVGPLVDELVLWHLNSQSAYMDGALEFLQPESFVKKENTGICTRPFNRIHVTYEGYLTMCCVDFQNYLAVADLNKTTLQQAWLAPAFVKMRTRHLEKQLTKTLCGNCWFGHTHTIEPVQHAFAAKTDFALIYKRQRKMVRARLKSLNNQS